mgnify:FL=1
MGESLLLALSSSPRARASSQRGGGGGTSTAATLAIAQAMSSQAGELSMDRAAAECCRTFVKALQPKLTAQAQMLARTAALAKGDRGGGGAAATFEMEVAEVQLREANASADAAVAALLQSFEKSQTDARARSQEVEDAREAARQKVLATTAEARAGIDSHYAADVI